MRILFSTLLLLSCVVTPSYACHTYSIPDTDELTEGPYWIDPMLNRTDITEGQVGLPFVLSFQVIDKSILGAACAATSDGNESNAPLTTGVGAMNNVQVDIWHANAAGHYSGFSQEGTAGLTWLRGYQRTNTTGQVTFHTIFPGYYTSRTTHIHVRIRVYDANQQQTYDDTTQIFFDDTFSDSVYAAASSTYIHGTRTTYNNNDNIYTSDMKMTVTVIVLMDIMEILFYIIHLVIHLYQRLRQQHQPQQHQQQQCQPQQRLQQLHLQQQHQQQQHQLQQPQQQATP